MTNLARNIRFGLRLLAKNLGFTCVALLALTLGIGANTAIFSVIYATFSLRCLIPIRTNLLSSGRRSTGIATEFQPATFWIGSSRVLFSRTFVPGPAAITVYPLPTIQK